MAWCCKQKILRNLHTKIDLVNEFSKVAGYKINTWKAVIVLHNSNVLSIKEILKSILFTRALKKISIRASAIKKNKLLIHATKRINLENGVIERSQAPIVWFLLYEISW